MMCRKDLLRNTDVFRKTDDMKGPSEELPDRVILALMTVTEFRNDFAHARPKDKKLTDTQYSKWDDALRNSHAVLIDFFERKVCMF